MNKYEEASKNYWKIHYAQAKILASGGIQMDSDGYPLATDAWIHDNLDPLAHRKWFTLEREKDSIMRKILKQTSRYEENENETEESGG